VLSTVGVGVGVGVGEVGKAVGLGKVAFPRLEILHVAPMIRVQRTNDARCILACNGYLRWPFWWPIENGLHSCLHVTRVQTSFDAEYVSIRRRQTRQNWTSQRIARKIYGILECAMSNHCKPFGFVLRCRQHAWELYAESPHRWLKIDSDEGDTDRQTDIQWHRPTWYLHWQTVAYRPTNTRFHRMTCP